MRYEQAGSREGSDEGKGGDTGQKPESDRQCGTR
jgi:hypothetical protein